MTSQGNSIPVSVEYTSRDYAALRTELIARMQSRIPNWTGNDAADFGLALVEAFAYMGDNLSYYIDRVANEGYIYTATQRASLLNIARTYGYSPAGYRTSFVDVQFSNGSLTGITIPAGTQVQASIVYNDTVEQLIFTTSAEVVLASGTLELDGSITPSVEVVSAFQGEDISTRTENLAISSSDQAGEVIGISDGTAEQSYHLQEPQVVDGTVVVYVQNGDSYELWSQVVHLSDYGPNDAVYSTTTDANDFVYVVFGDGVSGSIPNNNGIIKAVYVAGGGTISNVPANTIDTIHKIPGLTDAQIQTINSSVFVTNTSAALGGQDPEDNNTIRTNAPLALTTLNRAVTLQDFSNLALSVSQVGKSNSAAAAPTSVTLYISPQRNVGDTELYPSYTGDPANGGVLTVEWNSLRDSVVNFLTPRLQIGTTLTVSPPKYSLVSANIQFTNYPQYTTDVVLQNIKAGLVAAYSYSSSEFASIITPEDVEYVLRQVEGVSTAKVTQLYRFGTTAGRNILIGDPGELFILDNNSFSYQHAVLSNIVPSVGTLSPTYSSDVLSYSLTVPNGTSTITITPTHLDASTVIKVNDVVVASGAASSAISTNVGTTYITVVSYAGDGVRSYRIAVIRVS